ncbi:DUF421 domain-containing protein [Jeotgalibacillus campisalis]|uniref:DUF421 domain-containing protein n=1 Tax=Jeotgalibacillus campisalis TaxID=220754 RepID=A0A0C2S377_9BACL|nr:DUF421 domain-containing protein [Jeotgalibacillus campisalis]KIL48439.1 hypothetical protein KR50_14750 [Jeotgalibacillus campisalis]
MSLLELGLRIILSFFVLLVLTRLMGRQEISQLTFFNFVSGIAIGSIGANLAINPDVPVRNGLVGLIGWSTITIALEWLDIQSPKLRKALDGEPKILIKQGKIMEKELKKARVDLDALLSLLRDKDIFILSEVDYAIFETNGNLSVLKKSPPVPGPSVDSIKKSPVATTLVSDGKIHTENLTKLDRSEPWLHQQLMLSGVKSLSDVFYAGLQKDGTIYVDFKEDKLPE